MMNNIDYIIFDISIDGSINTISDNIETILGYTNSECKNKLVFEYIDKTSYNDFIDIISELIENEQEIRDLTIPVFDSEGNIVQLEVNAAPYFNNKKEFSGYIGLAKDKTMQINFENNLIKTTQELIESKEKIETLLNNEKILNQHKSQFLNMIAHQYRSPMTVISSTAQLIEMIYNKGNYNEIPKQTYKITESVNTLSDLINDVRRYVELIEMKDKPELTQVNLIDLFNSIINSQEIKSISNHNFIFDDTENTLIQSNFKYLKIAISNLLKNAINYSDHNSDIVFRFKTLDGIVLISIRDFGFGLSIEDKLNLFNPLYRNSKVNELTVGTGLGLATVYECVKLLDGEIDYISHEIGTEFIIKLKI